MTKTRNYYVLRESDEDTICITDKKEVAEWVAKNYPERCIIRWEEH